MAQLGSLGVLVERLDDVGIIEHSRGPVPDASSGHCTDDAGRALGLAARLTRDADSLRLATACVGQLERSITRDGLLHLRLGVDGRPTDDPPSDDAIGRALWGLSHALVCASDGDLRRRVLVVLEALVGFRSDHPRAAAHAVLAGSVLIRGEIHSEWGELLVASNRGALGECRSDEPWIWPDARLTYGNGLIVEAMLDVAALDGDAAATAEASRVLNWLVDHETSPQGHFSFVPVGGRGPGDPPGFDQQPIEPWTLASACARAAVVTGDDRWNQQLPRLLGWFGGRNDNGCAMWDMRTGAAYDGLTPHGVNQNEGAESAMALLGTIHAATLAQDRRHSHVRRREARRRTPAAIGTPARDRLTGRRDVPRSTHHRRRPA